MPVLSNVLIYSPQRCPRLASWICYDSHKFTIGWAWIPEYGDPDKAEDLILRAYSPS